MMKNTAMPEPIVAFVHLNAMPIDDSRIRPVNLVRRFIARTDQYLNRRNMKLAKLRVSAEASNISYRRKQHIANMFGAWVQACQFNWRTDDADAHLCDEIHFFAEDCAAKQEPMGTTLLVSDGPNLAEYAKVLKKASKSLIIVTHDASLRKDLRAVADELVEFHVLTIPPRLQ